MLPEDVRKNACRGLRTAMAEQVPIHPDVKPLATKICTDCELTADELLQFSMFHAEFDGEGERRDHLRWMQMGGAEGHAWAFPADPPTPEIDTAEVTQPRLDALTKRLNEIDDILRAKIAIALTFTMKVSADKVGIQLARAGVKKSKLPPAAKELHNELGNSLAFMHAVEPEIRGLIKVWAFAALKSTEEELALVEIGKLPDVILPAFDEANEERIDAIAEELGTDRSQVEEQFEDVYAERRTSIEAFLAIIAPAMVIGRLNKADDLGVPARGGVHPGVVDDLMRVGGGADFTDAGGVPYGDTGGRLRGGDEMEGDLFATSDDVLDAIEEVEGVRPVSNQVYDHKGPTETGKHPANPLHAAQHGKPRGEATIVPQAKRGCRCTWETAFNAAGITLEDRDRHLCEHGKVLSQPSIGDQNE